MSKGKQEGYRSDILSMDAINLAKVVGHTVLEPKTFSTGKVGYYGGGTTTIKCGEASYKFQIGLNLTAIETGKQDLSDEDKAAILSSKVMTADTFLKGRTAKPRLFNSGSVGFNLSEKITLEINGATKQFQLGLNITAHGSKTEDGKWQDARPVERAKKGEQAPA